jgi:hypothetical protein
MRTKAGVIQCALFRGISGAFRPSTRSVASVDVRAVVDAQEHDAVGVVHGVQDPVAASPRRT